MGDTGPVTTSATSRATAAPATTEQAGRAWPWLAAQALLLVVLAVGAVVRSDGGPRVMLAGLGLVGVSRGVAALRAARTGAVDRQGAVVGASAVWLGLVGMGLALLGAAVTGWVLVVLVAGVLAAMLVRAPSAARVRVRLLVAVAVAALVVGVVLAGPGWLPGVATLAVAAAVLVLGVATGVAAVSTRRAARRPAPDAAAGCGGCACGAGGCGGLQRG